MKRLLPGFLALLLAAPLVAQTPDPDAEGLSGSERLAALVARIQEEQAALRSLEATFTQRKESALLLEPEVSEGQVSYQTPDRVRWELSEPSPTVVVIRQGEMLTWYQDLGRAEVLHVGRQTDQILQYMTIGSSLETLKQYFTVIVRFPDGDAPYDIELEPRYERVRKRLAGMRIKLDRKLFVPVELHYTEADGDTTELHFSDIRVNQDLPAERFETALPEDVEVREIHLGEESAPE